jgi:hypothetical protein
MRSFITALLAKRYERVTKTRRTGWKGHAERMKRNSHDVLAGEPEGCGALAENRHR